MNAEPAPVLSSDDLASFWMPFTANRQFKSNPRLLVRADGMHYWTADGRQVLDGVAGLWCVNAGHGRREIAEAVTRQLHVMDYAPAFQMGHPLAFELANELVVAPAFYNTITTNCTTKVYRLAKPIDPGLPFDIRLLLTGYLPEYLERIGVLEPGVPLAELRKRGDITSRARATPITADFSAAIRASIR